MAVLLDAVELGTLTGGAGGIVFPIVLVPVYAVRAFSYSLIGLLRKTSQQSRRAAPRTRALNGCKADAKATLRLDMKRVTIQTAR